MKSLKYTLISLALLSLSNEVLACWNPWYTPRGYYMYRVHEQKPDISDEFNVSDPNASRNCREWQSLTSESIPLEDIYQVVYKMDMADFEKIYDSKKYDSQNKFIEWITTRDRSILEFLLLAKTNENIRLQRNSRWYYPSMKIGARMSLEEIADKALSVRDVRLRNRYLLQAIRALFSLSRYEECIAIWDSEVSSLPEDNLMRQLIHPYIAGAEFRVNNSEKAMSYFAQIGDVNSMLYCTGRAGEPLSSVEALELVCQYAPNSTYVREELQSYIRSIEPEGTFGWKEYIADADNLKRLYSLCLKTAKSKLCNNPAMWYYTAAFISDLTGEITNASRLLYLAEKSKSDTFIDESIKIFRIYLDAKLLPYNAEYETKLFDQIKWLDTKIANGIDDNVRAETSYGLKLINCMSYYYWNDMLRRIILAEVCPRMMKAGKTTRALQLANMADNRLLSIVDQYDVFDWVETENSYSFTMQEYRYSSYHNDNDYRNNFFELIDSLSVDVAVKYVKNIHSPKSDFDRYLNSRGYTNSEYLNDIIGTKYLREMKYKKAVEYLGKISKAYENHHNLYLEYDPFSLEEKMVEGKSDFKYDFAIMMHSLEESIKLTSEPNRKALLILHYAMGIKNSFDRCWQITQYYLGSLYWGQVCEKRNWVNGEYATAARARAIELSQQACEIATDDEVAANINYTLMNFKTVATKYPNTTMGKVVRGECDKLIDYQAISLRTIEF